MAPQAAQIAIFEKYGATYAWPVVYGKVLDVKYVPYCVLVHDYAPFIFWYKCAYIYLLGFSNKF